MTRTSTCFVIMLVTLLTLASSAVAVTGLPVARIGIVTDGPWARYPDSLELFKQEIITLAEGEFDIRFPSNRILDGGWNAGAVTAALDTLLEAPDVDLVVALGVVASNEACLRNELKKPVIAPFIVDDRLQRLPFKGGTSGVPNLNYINVQKSISEEVKLFTDIAPFKTLTVIADQFEINALEDVAKHMKAYEDEYGIGVEVIAYDASAEKTLEKLTPSTEAVFVTSLLRMPPDEFEKLVAGFIDRMLPSFSFWGMGDVETGILATMTPRSNIQHLARSVAVNVMEVLRGKNAGDLPVFFSRGRSLTINWATAKAIEVYPKWDIITGAELLNNHVEGVGRRMTLEGAVNESVRANLDLKALDRAVASGMEDVKKSRADLLPQVDIGSEARMIDDDRARAAQGQRPEKTWSGSLTGSQVIYSDKAWSAYTVSKQTQKALEEDRETLRLDIINSAAVAYLNVLRAEAVLNIQTDNLKLTRANLERAKVRVSVGAAGPEEVYRWESELANRLQDALNAESSLLDARSEMNRIMDRPLTEAFAPAEAGIRDPVSVVGEPRIFPYLETPRRVRVLSDFFQEESRAKAPELRAIDAQIAARMRVLTAAKREFWLPTFELVGNVTEVFDTSGDGTEFPPTTPEVPDDTNWTVGVTASLPLFSGGERSAELRQAREEIQRLGREREAAAARISQRAVVAMNRVRASYPGIRLSKDAAESAANNLQLVTDSYVRGVLSIIDLLDAQNLALVAEQQAANAVYDFLTDLMEVQRSVGAYFLYADQAERDVWFDLIEAYFSQ
ncbi:TolC family protein [Desulfoluna spongiiphila]|uniref:TolC family protein n=1 Tax=Desulfoluna spongiiphila TaxID=419481 RepID=UPI001257C57F|nr:TolC family protein [Desulfoluna spongiiphila]VVS95002.1 outer membrane efflux protein [Desulfoluna spongiiphila]